MGASEDLSEGAEAAEPASRTPDRRALPRGLLGYRRADVEEALATRDAELVELRQDIAALWLAFAQHDRLIRTVLSLPEQGGPQPAARTAPGSAPRREPAADPGERRPTAGAAAGGDSPPPAISRQLSELDEVLSAIEMATQTLEETYADEIGGAAEATPPKVPSRQETPSPPAGEEPTPDPQERS